tara:strand:+ start:249347 stop:250543 length:1197 start_codon:yes stop_codon:yes gene_type:complete
MSVQAMQKKGEIAMRVLPLSLLRLFLLQCVMTLILTLTMQDAYAQRGGRGGGRGGNGGSNGPVHTNPSSSFLSVNQYMYDGDRLPLHNKMDLSMADALEISAQSSSWNAALEIKLNRQTIQTVQLSSYMQAKKVLIPQLHMGDKLVLKVIGQVYIQSIEATKAYSPGPGNGQNDRLVALLHGQFTASTTLKVRKLIAEQNGRGVLQGKNVKKVVLVASSARGRAQAQLLINGQPVGWSQTIPTYKTRLVFELNGRRNVVGNQIQSIELKINGRAVTLNRIAVVTNNSQGGHHGGGQHPRQSVGVQVNRSFLGSQNVSLQSLIGYQRVNMHAPVRKLIIDVAGHGNVMVNGAGMRLGSVSSLGRISTSETVHVNGAASIAQISMRVAGRLTIKSITIQY